MNDLPRAFLTETIPSARTWQITREMKNDSPGYDRVLFKVDFRKLKTERKLFLFDVLNSITHVANNLSHEK